MRRRPFEKDEAKKAFESGRYRDALASLVEVSDIGALTLRLRILLRSGATRFAEAISLIEQYGSVVQAKGTDEERAIFSAIAGRIYEVAGFEHLSRQWYVGARGYGLTLSDDNTIAELSWYLGASALTRRDYEGALDLVEVIERAPSALWRARAEELRGVIAAAEGRYEEQFDAYERALVLLADSDERDNWFQGHLLRMLSMLSVSLGERRLIETTLERVNSFAWSADQATQKFYSFFELGLAVAAFGDQVRAFRLLRSAVDYAPGAPARILALASRARQAFARGETLFALDSVEAAVATDEEFSRVRGWDTTTFDERLALLELAIAQSELDPAAARVVLDRYASFRPSGDAARAIATADPRAQAEFDLARGIIASRLGERDNAATWLQAALDVYAPRRHAWRAMQCATELAAIGVHSPAIDAVIADGEDRFRGSWLLVPIKTPRPVSTIERGHISGAETAAG